MNEDNAITLHEDENGSDMEGTLISEDETLFDSEPAADDLIEETQGANSDTAENADNPIDYEEIMQSDLSELKREFPELRQLSSVTELNNPLRYAALRDMGLSATEAYLATAGKRRVRDNRAHLSASAPRPAGSPSYSMSRQELESAREIFGGMSDAEIQSLYRKVIR